MFCATWLRRAGWLGAFAFAISAIQITRADEPPKGKVAAQEESDDLGPASVVPRLKRRVVIAKDLIDDIRPGDHRFGPDKYSLKLALTDVPKSLDAQLQLDGDGALVISVIEGGPADKAGLKVHDILVTVADKPIKKLADVIKVVNDSDGKELAFKVLRAGEPITVTITPERPTVQFDNDRVRRYRRAVDEATSQADKAAKEATRRVERELRDLEKKLGEKLKDAGVDVRMQVIQPGRFVPHGFFIAEHEEFPDDLDIDIRKQGNEPAKIEIKQGDESWNVTDDKLDELPENIRKHVQTMLGRAGPRYSVAMPKLSEESRQRAQELAAEARERAESVAAEAQERARAAAETARERAAEIRERLGDRLERRLDELSREMKQMRQRMEELRRSLRESADIDEDEKNSDNEPDEADET